MIAEGLVDDAKRPHDDQQRAAAPVHRRLVVTLLGVCGVQAQDPGADASSATETLVQRLEDFAGHARPQRRASASAAARCRAIRAMTPAPESPACRRHHPAAAPLVAGQVIQPIDLASALRLAGARDLDIATARQRVLQAAGRPGGGPGALAAQPLHRADLLPPRRQGPVDHRPGPDGRAAARCSWARRPAWPTAFPPRLPGSGFPPLNSLSGVLRISDAIYGTRAARRVIAANEAGVKVATNNALLAASEAYFDLQQAAGTLAIAREAAGNAEVLAGITGTYARSGAGLEADHRRILTELRSRQRSIRLAVGELEVASANLVRPLLLDPHIVVAPVEPAEAVIRLVADDAPLDDLICQGWRNRPELGRARELVQAAVLRLKQAKLRPFVPSLAMTYSGGGFGGGQNGFFGNFNTRGDAAVSLFWELRGLGLADRGHIRRAQADRNTADIDLARVQAQVANDVVASYKARLAASEAMDEARASVAEAIESLELNLTNIRRGAGLPGADPADRGPAAGPGPGPGACRLPRRRARLQPRPVPPLPGDRPTAARERKPTASAGPNGRCAETGRNREGSG